MDPQMAETAAQCEVPLILMHIQGSPRTMQVDPQYDDLIAEVHQYLEQAMAGAIAAGVDPGHIIIDPGIGFGKTLEHNLTLIHGLDAFADLEAPILVGPSRKTFIRKILSAETDRDPSPDSPEVETGTQAAVAASILNGAHIVRVHNVANTKAMIQVLDAIRNAY
jgi:dihydropteroate synthase